MQPNTFILGAPRCGTTALANWLGDHPQVHKPTIKETFFFSCDVGHRRCTSLKQYETIFSDADPAQHRIAFDASTDYLYSRATVPAIRQYAQTTDSSS